jgi:hypothetical protein
MITGSGRFWVLPGLWVSRLTAALGHAGLAGPACWRGSWAGPGHTGEGGEAGWAASGFRPIRLGKIEDPFSFSNPFYKFQTNLNSNQI